MWIAMIEVDKNKIKLLAEGENFSISKIFSIFIDNLLDNTEESYVWESTLER